MKLEIRSCDPGDGRRSDLRIGVVGYNRTITLRNEPRGQQNELIWAEAKKNQYGRVANGQNTATKHAGGLSILDALELEDRDAEYGTG
uniref:Integrase n=1 Tax=Heterorhabditis bacteriophora TaxID=37862 RepID=A0A1I7XG94_HETBA